MLQRCQKKLYSSLNLAAKLRQSNKKVSRYLNLTLSVLSTIDERISTNGCQLATKIYILEDSNSDATSLLSRSDCIQLKLVKRLQAESLQIVRLISLNSILETYEDVSNRGTTKLFFCYHMKLEIDTPPIVEPITRVPFAVKSKLKTTFDDMEAHGNLIKVSDPTD